MRRIEQNDERNIAITRAAFTVSAVAAILLFAILAFVFVALGYRIPSYLCIGRCAFKSLHMPLRPAYIERKCDGYLWRGLRVIAKEATIAVNGATVTKPNEPTNVIKISLATYLRFKISTTGVPWPAKYINIDK